MVLFQLPPYFRKDIDALRGFLPLLPADIPCAFEFRHESWQDPDVYAELTSYGKPLCLADDPERPMGPVVSTAPVGYLRLRRVDYDPQDITAWAELVTAQDWEECYVFFKHEDEAGGPAHAQQLLTLTAD